MKSILTLSAAGLAILGFGALAQELSPLKSHSEPDRMDWSNLDTKFYQLLATSLIVLAAMMIVRVTRGRG